MGVRRERLCAKKETDLLRGRSDNSDSFEFEASVKVECLTTENFGNLNANEVFRGTFVAVNGKNCDLLTANDFFFNF